jgi:ribosomal protein L17
MRHINEQVVTAAKATDLQKKIIGLGKITTTEKAVAEIREDVDGCVELLEKILGMNQIQAVKAARRHLEIIHNVWQEG